MGPKAIVDDSSSLSYLKADHHYSCWCFNATTILTLVIENGNQLLVIEHHSKLLVIITIGAMFIPFFG